MDSHFDSADDSGSEESTTSSRGAPRSLAEYRLLKRLGAGGMGRVYKAMHRRLERLVAIKLLPRYLAGDSRALARFDREIKAAGRVNHPNVVQAFDAREIDGTRFLVMEFVDGVNLSLLVRTCGRLEIADACELARQAALGLQAAHEHGLVHRDIKPSNMMLSRGGQLKILDLGLARFRAEPAEPGEASEAGETIGTAEYIAPEQVADSRRADIRADIYSLGCSTYWLLTGRTPFLAVKYRSADEKMMAHLNDPLSSIREMRNEVSEPLAAIIARMVAKDPGDRFATPAEAAAALAPYAAGSDLPKLLSRYDAGHKGIESDEPIRFFAGGNPGPSLGTAPAPADESQFAASSSVPKKKEFLAAWAFGAAAIALLSLALFAGRQLWTTSAKPSDKSPHDTARADDKPPR